MASYRQLVSQNHIDNEKFESDFADYSCSEPQMNKEIERYKNMIAIEDLVSLTDAGFMYGFIMGLSALAYIPFDLKDCLHAKDKIKEFE